MEENTNQPKQKVIIITQPLPGPLTLRHPWYYYAAGVAYVIFIMSISVYIMFTYSGI